MDFQGISDWVSSISPELLAVVYNVGDATKSVADQVVAFLDAKIDKASSSKIVVNTKDRVHRAQADLYWHDGWLGNRRSERIPLPSKLDERALIALISLAKTLTDEVNAHGPRSLQQPVTITVIAGTVGTFFWPGGLPLRQVCLSPYCVVQKGQIGRLLSPAIGHLDLAHLASNLAAAIPELCELERTSGTLVAAAEVVGLTAASHGVYVVWAWGQKAAFGRREEYYSVGALGLSSLAFALQVVAGERRSTRRDTQVLVAGWLPFPARYTWAVQLVLTVVASPESSFPGHMAGVAAGLMYVYGVSPLLRLFGLRPRTIGAGARWDAPMQAAPAHFYGAGTTGGRQLGPQGRSRAAWWKSWAKDLAGQLALLAGAAALHYMVGRSRSGARRSINSWQW